ncbi:MAG: hypothetical protein KBD12_01390 [Candidatus Pacebacteria bacterium]|nr:hypothetical protein [Candidatus Paceibacterota bacterium]
MSKLSHFFLRNNEELFHFQTKDTTNFVIKKNEKLFFKLFFKKDSDLEINMSLDFIFKLDFTEKKDEDDKYKFSKYQFLDGSCMYHQKSKIDSVYIFEKEKYPSVKIIFPKEDEKIRHNLEIFIPKNFSIIEKVFTPNTIEEIEENKNKMKFYVLKKSV